MKMVDKIRIILLGPLAVYMVYDTFTESWTRTNNIMVIDFIMASAFICSTIVERMLKSNRNMAKSYETD
jgi:hypothetical protein